MTDNIKLDKAKKIIDHWIQSEILCQESIDEKYFLEFSRKRSKKSVHGEWNLKNCKNEIPKPIKKDIIEAIKAVKSDKKNNPKLFRMFFSFGKLDTRLYMKYFQKKYLLKKIPYTDFSEDGSLAVCSLDISGWIENDTWKGRLVYEYAPLLFAEDYLNKDDRDSFSYLLNYKNLNFLHPIKFRIDWDSNTSCFPFEKEDDSFWETINKKFEEQKEIATKRIEGIFDQMKNVLTLQKEWTEEEKDHFIKKMYGSFYVFSHDKKAEDERFNEYVGLGIHSHYIQDLEYFRELLNNNSYPKSDYANAVIRFINAAGGKKYKKGRINISPEQNWKDKFFKYLNPNMAPEGKWPSNYNPYLMQQLAINLSRNNATPIFSVNGPPGTGKTTLIQEVIADVITQKVVRLSRILKKTGYDPDDLFKNQSLKKEYEELFDYGIIVASNTNAAVENITRELPEKLKDNNIYRDLIVEKSDHFYELPIMATLGRKANFEGYRNNKVVKKYYESTSIHKNLKEKLKSETDAFLDCYEKTKKELEEYSSKSSEYLKKIWDNYQAKDKDKYKEAQQANPITDENLNSQRVELFLRAWKVHQLFAECSEVVRNMVRNRLNDSDIDQGKPDEIQLYYNSVFFVSPVISSTFASIGRTFKKLKKPESLGILIVDESGQVLPQNTIGALFRAKKALIVGDPKQIPPVVQSPLKAANNITCPNEFKGSPLVIGNTGEEKISSLQICADSINPYGTMIDDTWVGCPMVLHSRCISPMFNISNQISYGNTMINITKDVEEEKKQEFILDSSYWIQIKGKESSGEKNHFVRRQANAVLKMIREKCAKIDEGEELSLFVISPFRSVSERFQRYIKYHIENSKKKIKANPKVSDVTVFNPSEKDTTILKKWIKKNNIGTVHTFQGKQADEVIFFLGCDSSSQTAAAWVYKNIVNVAASRAR